MTASTSATTPTTTMQLHHYVGLNFPVPTLLAESLTQNVENKRRADLVFTSPEGEVLRVRNFRRGVFDRAVAETGLAPLTPHDLRHTAASIAISAGATVLGVQRMLGHKKPSTTLDVYSNVFEADIDYLAEAVSNLRAMRIRG